MNHCSFTGFLTEDPRLHESNGVSQARFTIVTYNYRTAKSTGEKSRIPTFISCEAWHTGAETICKLFKKALRYMCTPLQNIYLRIIEILYSG